MEKKFEEALEKYNASKRELDEVRPLLFWKAFESV